MRLKEYEHTFCNFEKIHTFIFHFAKRNKFKYLKMLNNVRVNEGNIIYLCFLSEK